MKFEDVLPAIKAGRLARRLAWADGCCVSGPGNYNKNIPITYIVKFHKYDRNGSNGTYPAISDNNDMFKDDWELVPDVLPNNGCYYVLPALTELADRFKNSNAEARPSEVETYLEVFATRAMIAYKTGKVDPLLEALDNGILALLVKRKAKEEKTPYPYGIDDD